MAKTGRPKGRPQKSIDQDMFEKMCSYQCTEEEICGMFGISVDTLERWCKLTYKATFAEVFKEKRQKGKMSLRRSQFKLAEKNATMAIWLGKQYLDQRDKDITDAVEKTNGVLESILALRNNSINGNVE